MREIYELIYNQYGHFYVCGDVKMAADVTKTLELALQHEGKMSIDEAQNYLYDMKVNIFIYQNIKRLYLKILNLIRKT